jgi:aldehyde:ferredoxin oxidoreductase
MESGLRSGLHADLTRGTVEHETLSPETFARYRGGRALAAHFLLPHGKGGEAEPDTPLLFLAGPLAGTGLPGTGSACISFLSPLTDTIFSESAGGSLGGALRRAGVSWIRVTGKSKRPAVLDVTPGRAILSDDPWSPGEGDPLDGWKGSVAHVGRAALTGCRFATVAVDRHWEAARGGAGLVMARKGLYRLRVRGGDAPLPVADPAALEEAGSQAWRLFRASPVLDGPFGFSRFGTASLLDLSAVRRILPVRNFRATWCEGASALSAIDLARIRRAPAPSCPGCPLPCRFLGPAELPLPDYDSLALFGLLLEEPDLLTAVKADAFCRRAGMDPVSAASTVAAYAETTGRDFDGKELLDLLGKIADGKDDGELLAQGSLRCARALGHPSLSMSVKGLEIGAFDPRGAMGIALSLAVCSHGGDWRKALMAGPEILRKPAPADPATFAGKARMVKSAEDQVAAGESLSVCHLAFLGASVEEYARALSAIIGTPVDGADLLRTGERAVGAERIVNRMRGFGAAEDTLPERFFREEGTSGNGVSVPALDRDAFSTALKRYYAVRGLEGDGAPSSTTARSLSLPEVPR